MCKYKHILTCSRIKVWFCKISEGITLMLFVSNTSCVCLVSLACGHFKAWGICLLDILPSSLSHFQKRVFISKDIAPFCLRPACRICDSMHIGLKMVNIYRCGKNPGCHRAYSCAWSAVWLALMRQYWRFAVCCLFLFRVSYFGKENLLSETK